MRDLVPQPGIKPEPPALEVQSYPLDCQGSSDVCALKPLDKRTKRLSMFKFLLKFLKKNFIILLFLLL